jgi:hypothetical protein
VLDLPLGLPGRGVDQGTALLECLRHGVLGDHPHGRGTERSGHEPIDHVRKPTRHPGGGDPVRGRILGEPEDLDAELEQGRKSESAVELPRVELGKVDDQGHRRLAFVGGQFPQCRRQPHVIQ